MTSPNPRALIQPEYIWFDGELIAAEEAMVHFLSPSLHYGLSVFEGIRSYATDFGPAIFRLHDHLDRFLHSVAALGFDELPFSEAELHNGIIRTVLANSYLNCYIRPMMFFSGGITLNVNDYVPHFGVAAWKWNRYLQHDAYENGVRASVSDIVRTRANVALTKAKVGGQYATSVIAKTMAAQAGYDEAILLDVAGDVAECAGQHLMIVRGHTISTPPSVDVLEGVTRDTVLTLARDTGYTVAEERITPEEMMNADEVFICGTAAEVIGVREIDGVIIGNGRVGKITGHVQQLYDDTVHGKNQYAAAWLDQMVLEPII